MRKATAHPSNNLMDRLCGVQSFSDSSLALGSLFVRLSSFQRRQKQNNKEEHNGAMLARLSINGESHVLGPSSMQRLLSHAKTACNERLCALFSLLERAVVKCAVHAWISAVTAHPQTKSKLQVEQINVEEVLSSDLRETARKLVGYMYLWRREMMQRAFRTWQRETRTQRRVIERCFDAWKLRVMKRRAATATLDRLLWKHDDNRRTQVRACKRRRWQQWKEVTEMLRRQELMRQVWQAWLLFVKRQRLNRVRIQRLHMAIWRRHFLLRCNERFVSQKADHRTLQEAFQTWRRSYRRRSALRRCIARMQQKALSRAWSAWVEFACVAVVAEEAVAVAEADEGQPAARVMSPTRTHDPEHHHVDEAGQQRRHRVCRCVRCFRRYGRLGAAEPSHSEVSFAVFESQCSLDEHLERRLRSARKLAASSATKPKSKRKIKPATTKPKPRSLNASTASQQDDGTERLQKLFQAAHAIVQAHSHML